ncbi:cytochrome c3 family protein [Paracoccus sp. S-4012]|uniref:cytochrome c3 family protein n=1 Tax=Paracoccus sp. S-4012 TaxID=2665648 RepID=UPI0018A1EB22|nr:cytochrome c3 family protein [Paracoccus sp. S-4012]
MHLPGGPLAQLLALTLALGAQAALAQDAPPTVGAGGAPAVIDPAETPATQPSQTPWVIPPSGPFSPQSIPVPNADEIAAWARSAHANPTSESFSHWNEQGEIPPVCANCHSGIGFRAYHGLDGGEPGPLRDPVPTGGVVDCGTCHNPGLAQISEVALPNGMMHPAPSGEVTCLTCHQGRASGAQVEAATAGKDDDLPDPTLSFINPHYAIAAASWLGGYGALGYHYPGRDYAGRFLHAAPVATCNSCHEPHSLEVAEASCLTCHQTGEASQIRIARQSYDGSGDTAKGIHADIAANAARLLAMAQDYAATVAGTPMIYDAARHPFFFADANGDGLADQRDGASVPYGSWTPRLLRAAYNWKFVNADPGIHVHNPPYALQLLHDSIEDLSGPLNVDFEALGMLR